jgi:tetratricopeptide (TPR) repeat protein
MKTSFETNKKTSSSDALKEGDMFMSVVNVGSLISQYLKAVNIMKKGDFEEALPLFEKVLERLFEEKTLFVDVYRLYGNLGICKVLSNDMSGFDFLEKSILINPKYKFAESQIKILKKHFKDLYKSHLEYKKFILQSKGISGLRSKKVNKNKISIYIPTIGEKYYIFLMSLGIDFGQA